MLLLLTHFITIGAANILLLLLHLFVYLCGFWLILLITIAALVRFTIAAVYISATDGAASSSNVGTVITTTTATPLLFNNKSYSVKLSSPPHRHFLAQSSLQVFLQQSKA